MPDGGGLAINENDFFCEKIFEIAVKMKLDLYPTALLATNIYHRSSEALNLPKDADTRYVLAASSLLLAAKSYGDSSVNSDDVLLHFYPLFFHEELDLTHPGPEYDSVSTLMIHITWLIFNKLDFNIRCKLPSDYLLEFLPIIRPLLTHQGLSKFDICKSAWALVFDFHMRKQSVLFKPGYVAIAALYVILRNAHILISGSPTPDVMDWITLCDEDATPETILPIVDAILTQHIPTPILQKRMFEIPPLPSVVTATPPPAVAATPPPLPPPAVAATPPPPPPPEIEETMPHFQ